MSDAILEHVNVTVKNPQASAALLCELFDWTIRWQGDALNNGHTVHVGGDSSYVALYSVSSPTPSATSSYETINGLNHLGIVVHDLDVLEARAKSLDLTPRSHGDYEPGKRFYIDIQDELEIEVISYT